MKPGEVVVAAVPFEGSILVFGDRGSVLSMERDPITREITFRAAYDLPQQ